ncbi:MAG: hypothetical protein NTY53_17660, partial [Kiritimatiellaeota bacterium]|nr:hypothetical protein [Kiritimatiellota bacterium]
PSLGKIVSDCSKAGNFCGVFFRALEKAAVRSQQSEVRIPRLGKAPVRFSKLWKKCRVRFPISGKKSARLSYVGGA